MEIKIPDDPQTLEALMYLMKGEMPPETINLRPLQEVGILDADYQITDVGLLVCALASVPFLE